jgi:hypothetical protein
MSRLAIRTSSVVCLTVALAAGIMTGCSNRASSTRPEHPQSAAPSEDEEVMRPASASLVIAAPETTPPHSAMADDWTATDLRSRSHRRNAELDPGDGADTGAANCSMHAEETLHGIAVVFSTRNGAPEGTRAQVRALAAEIERQKGRSPDPQIAAEPSSFGTRQIAELTAQTAVTDTPEGGTLTISAKDPDQVAALRARVLWNMAGFLPDSRDTRGECPVVPRLAAEPQAREAESQSRSAK